MVPTPPNRSGRYTSSPEALSAPVSTGTYFCDRVNTWWVQAFTASAASLRNRTRASPKALKVASIPVMVK